VPKCAPHFTPWLRLASHPDAKVLRGKVFFWILLCEFVLLFCFGGRGRSWAQGEAASKEESRKGYHEARPTQNVNILSTPLTPEEQEIIRNWEVLELWDMLEEDDISLFEDLETIEQIKE
jgi:hypothetical protein